jgi:hypothetical protein
VAQLAAGEKAPPLLGEGKVGCEHIAGQHPEHIVQHWQGPHNAAQGFQRVAKVAPFVRPGDRHLL